MSSPDKFFCAVIETQYNGYRAIIDFGLQLTPEALRLVKSQIQFYQAFTLDVIDKNVSYWEDQILKLFDSMVSTEGWDRFNDSRMAFCRTAFACEALREAMFPSSPDPFDSTLDPAWVDPIPAYIRNQLRLNSTDNSYELFEKFVCKLSLRALLDTFRNKLMDDLDALITKWLSLLTDPIDEWIQNYFDFLGKTKFGVDGINGPKGKTIFEWLELLDLFAKCASEACNFIETAGNFKDDAAERAAIQEVGENAWTFKTLKWVSDARNKELELRQRISQLSDKMVLFRNDGTTGSGVKPDEVVPK